MESKTKKVLMGVSSAILVGGLVGCQENADLPAQPIDPDCDEWEWDYDDGVYECEENTSRYYGHYYYGGTYYKNKPLLKASSSYKSYLKSPSYKGSSSSKGFGSGSSYSGS